MPGERFGSGNTKNWEKIQWLGKDINDSNGKKIYRIVKEIGKGSYGQAFDAQHHLTGAQVVIKKMEKRRNPDVLAESEAKVISLFQHENFPRVFGSYQNTYHWLLSLERVHGETSCDYIVNRGRPLTEPHTVMFILQLVDAIQHLNSKGVMHRDIHLGNVMIDNTQTVKLIDFGRAAKILPGGNPSGSMFNGQGAPEMFLSVRHSKEVDIFGIGFIAYILLTEWPPFDLHPKTRDIARKNMQDGPKTQIPPWNALSSDAKDLLQKLLEYSPVKRITLAGILQHPFITKNRAAALRIRPPISNEKKQQYLNSTPNADLIKGVKLFFPSMSDEEIRKTVANAVPGRPLEIYKIAEALALYRMR
ncbi:calcium/calmodulin-dependent protein kinase type 1G-like [Sycon ciliatum]|uniref:calcium/calmodulin-dependent protein kinase type 1G-like n=1 Tax=Sycon ciliatum TaxID=27933 RepID=UPI0031F67AD6